MAQKPGKKRARKALIPEHPANSGIIIGGNVGNQNEFALGDITKDNKTVHIKGSTRGTQINLGSNSTQEQTQNNVTLTAAEKDEVARLIADLQQKITALELPAKQQEAAQKKAGELQQEITSPKPSSNKIKQIGEWLLKHLPALAGTISSVFLSPVVGKVVEATGELAAGWVKERFSPAEPSKAE